MKMRNTINFHCRDKMKERSVMNNYFGIGIDAKISLDFHNKREAAAGFAHKHWMGLSTFIAILLPPNMRMGSFLSMRLYPQYIHDIYEIICHLNNVSYITWENFVAVSKLISIEAENTVKSRSRAKNYMLYGMLGSKELLQK